MRKFKRHAVSSLGFILEDSEPFKILISDFSRMGLSFQSVKILQPKSFLSIVYQNESGQLVQMKIYIKNVSQKCVSTYRVGAQFVAVESRN